MKLFRVEFMTIRRGDPAYLVVAQNEKEALEKANAKFDGYSLREDAIEISEVDGYRIILQKKKVKEVPANV